MILSSTDDYADKVRDALLTQHGVSRSPRPLDGVYPCTINGAVDYVRILDGRVHAGNATPPRAQDAPAFRVETGQRWRPCYADVDVTTVSVLRRSEDDGPEATLVTFTPATSMHLDHFLERYELLMTPATIGTIEAMVRELWPEHQVDLIQPQSGGFSVVISDESGVELARSAPTREDAWTLALWAPVPR